MRIIDEKGKLFGKINVFDFLVIIFLFCLIPMFYFVYKISTKKHVEVALEKEFIEVQIDCQLIKVKPEVAKIISVGDKELGKNMEIIGEIVSLGQSAPYQYKLDIGEGQKIVKEEPDLKQIKAKLKLKAEVKQDNLYYKDTLIKIGSPLEFKTNKYNLIAIPLEKKEVRLEQRTVDLYVTLKDLDEDILKKVSVGDKEVGENGEIIAEIIDLGGKIETNSLDFDLGSGNFVRGEDSSKKQISAKMRLRCQVESGNQIYFREEKIRYNLPFEFKTDKYKVNVLLGKIFEVTSPPKEKKILLQVKFTGIAPEIANILQKDDIEKDPFEKTVARISSIIINKPSQVLALKEDEFIPLQHPFNRDILIFLDVQCIEKEGVYYFKNYPVKMGNNIVFSTDLYSISGLIVGMEIK